MILFSYQNLTNVISLFSKAQKDINLPTVPVFPAFHQQNGTLAFDAAAQFPLPAVAAVLGSFDLRCCLLKNIYFVIVCQHFVAFN